MKNINRIQGYINHVEIEHFKLVLIIGVNEIVKTMTLKELCNKNGYEYINLSKEISCQLKEYGIREKALVIEEILENIIRDKGKAIVLDKTEVLFSKYLKINPLKQLQLLSKNTIIVAAWNGKITDNKLTFANPSHSDFFEISTKEVPFYIEIQEDSLYEV